MLRRSLELIRATFAERTAYVLLMLIGMGAGLIVGLPPASASATWRGDYETNDWSQWGGSGHLQVVTGGSASIETDTVRQGSYAAKFTTPPFDGTNRSRSQIYLNGDSTYGNEGQENWFAWSTMIGAGSVLEEGSWNNLTSFHQRSTTLFHNLPAPDHFAVTNASGVWTLRLDSWGGNYDDATGWNQYRQTWNFMRLQTQKWYDIVFHVKWSADPTVGFVEVWINGVHVLPLTHAATLYTGDGIYLKQGYDGGGASGSTTVYNDGTVLANDYAGAITAFPAGTWPSQPDGSTTTTTSAPTTTTTTTTTTATNSTATAPATLTNSLSAGATLSGTYQWKVTTSGDCAKVEFWATNSAGIAVKLGEVVGTSGTYVFPFDTSKLASGSYLFGVVEDDSAGVRYKDPNRITASIQNTTTSTAPTTTTTTTTATTTTTPTTTATTTTTPTTTATTTTTPTATATTTTTPPPTTTTSTTTSTSTTPSKSNSGDNLPSPPGHSGRGKSGPDRQTSAIVISANQPRDAQGLAAVSIGPTPNHYVQVLSTAVFVKRTTSLRVSVIRAAGIHRRVPLLAHSHVGTVEPMYWRKTIVTGSMPDGRIALRLRIPKQALHHGTRYAVRVRAVGLAGIRTVYIRFRG